MRVFGKEEIIALIRTAAEDNLQATVMRVLVGYILVRDLLRNS